MKSTLKQGKLISWQDERGFGFIRPVSGDKKVFIHVSELKGSTRRPQQGDMICYRTTVDEEGRICACNAFVVGARKQATPPPSLKPRARASRSGLHPLPFVGFALLGSLPLFGAARLAWTGESFIPLMFYAVMGCLTFGLYAEDKTRAQTGKWRVSEKTLHLCEFMGGWTGGFVGQQLLRHKSRKQSYQLFFWIIIGLHMIGWLGWFLGLGPQ
ncbi:DUF1294 domain-containing protein [Leptolyngbya cf. ectocarpi LEGE 11479]|uniref:DUF1294 domain-containing protein n=1 Tax=Leptolyngbya cf. ectocarpi LEGE 11479 TaxID=1828722 RepID=A0A928ZTY2_LEPEC|nr:DUF1294 domain-containing protein [Leptolyngbya ectocarpi]MBE9067391.1 DUF1294 domain-containing protein [Leptolyngbya cf. ectocarpi LEGE 11479]